MTIGDRIKAARKKAGMTQAELANRLGISYVGISQWENNLRNPKIGTLKKIADALGVPLGELSGLDDAVDSLSKSGLSLEDVSEEMSVPLDTLRHVLDNDEIPSDFVQKVASVATALSSELERDTRRLTRAFFALNYVGQQKAIERVEELTEIPKYQRQPPQDTPATPSEGSDHAPPETPSEGPQEGK